MDLTLHYWPLPFRAQSFRYLMADRDVPWTEAKIDDLIALKSANPQDAALPFMAPPVLHDQDSGLWLAQSSAIALFLSQSFDALPKNPSDVARHMKIFADCIDVMGELTQSCGLTMWTPGEWATFRDERLQRWLQIFEQEHRTHQFDADAPMLADYASAALWATIMDTLPELIPHLSAAPRTLEHARKVADRPAIARLRAEQQEAWGNLYCSGQIEASLREMLAN